MKGLDFMRFFTTAALLPGCHQAGTRNCLLSGTEEEMTRRGLTLRAVELPDEWTCCPGCAVLVFVDQICKSESYIEKLPG